mgnify:CR=1 FL=1
MVALLSARSGDLCLSIQWLAFASGVSALVWALAQGDAPPDALRWGVAAGAAALLAPGTALAQREEILRLLAAVPAPQAVASPG